MMRYRPYTLSEIRRACLLRGRGHSTREIAALTGRAPAQLKRHLARYGGPCPPPDSAEAREKLSRARSERCRRLCAESGWPEVSHPAQARVLCVLAAADAPLTHREVALRLGLRLTVNGQNSELARHLRRLAVPRRLVGLPGMVLRLPPLPGGRAPRYALSGWLLARRREGDRVQ